MHTSCSRVFVAGFALLVLTFWGVPASAQEISHGGTLELESAQLDSEGTAESEDCAETEATEVQRLVESAVLRVEPEVEGAEQIYALCAGSDRARVSDSLDVPAISTDEMQPVIDLSEGGLPREPLTNLRSGTLIPLPAQPLQSLPLAPTTMQSRVGTWGGLASFVIVTAMELRHPDSTRLPADLGLSASRVAQYPSANPAQTTAMTSMEPVALRWNGL